MSLRLTDLAEAIADGTPIDWTRADSDAPAAVAAARIVARIAELHASLPPTEMLSSSAHKSLLTLSDEEIASAQSLVSWGPLTILQRIGDGTYGNVYRAHDPRLNRDVALKLLRRKDRRESVVIDEGHLMARVRHPNVVTVYGAERIDGRVGLWMEFIDGPTLEADLRRRGPFGAHELASIGVDLCRALGAVHRAGLLHRDLKTQNVMRDADGRLVLTDFGAGCAAATNGAGGPELAGTPLYLAPELLDGHPASEASDIYGLGVVLYHLATGSYPVRAGSIEQLREAHAVTAAPSVKTLRTDLPRALADVIDQLIAHDPARRGTLPEIETALSPRGRRLGAWIGVTAGALLVTAIVWIGLRSGPRALNTSNDATGQLAIDASDGAPRTVRLPQYPMGRASRDGRYFPYISANGDLQVWDATTGQSRVAIHRTDAVERFSSPVMSPDGTRVAYARDVPGGGWELQTVGADGTWPVVLVPHQIAYSPAPLDWSADGSTLLARLNQRDGTVDLVLVSVHGGTPTIIQTFGNGAPTNASLSIDGRFVAYRRLSEGQPRQEAIYVVSTDGSPARLVAASAPGDRFPYDRVPIWTPDGKFLAFSQGSAKETALQELWLVRIADGVPVDEPFRAVSALGGVTGVNVTNRGALLYMAPQITSEVYTASIDISGTEIVRGVPSLISKRDIGEHNTPRWSPDGTSIAYISLHPNARRGFNPIASLMVHDLVSGNERQLAPQVDWLSLYAPEWIPDSGSLIVWAATGHPARHGFFRIDVTTSTTRPVAWSEATPVYFHPTPDGRDLLYIDARGIIAHNLSDNSERVLAQTGSRTISGEFGITHDGMMLAFVERTTDGNDILTVQPLSSPASRELLRVPAASQLRFQQWSVNDESILYSIRTRGSNDTRLWRVPVAGGQPQDVHLTVNPGLGSLSPDGHRVAYAEKEAFWNLWIDRFHPQPASDGARR